MGAILVGVRVGPRVVGVDGDGTVVCPELAETISDDTSTASMFEPTTFFIYVFNMSLSQPSFGAPLMYQADPPSARTKPYFLTAVRITWIGVG